MRGPVNVGTYSRLPELVLAGAGDEGEDTAGDGGCAVGCVVGVPGNAAALAVDVCYELLAGLVLDRERAHDVEAVVDQFFGGHGGAVHRGDALDDVLHAGEGIVAEFVCHEVDAFYEGSAVDPLVSGVPSFYAGRVEEALSHEHWLERDFFPVGMGFGQGAGDFEGACDYFGGVADALVRGVLEEVRVEDHPQHWLDFVAVLDERLADGADGFWVSGGFDRPGRHLRLIGDEEVVQVAGDEDVARGLSDDDVDDVEPVECANVSEVMFLRCVVVFRVELVVP